MPTTTNGPRYQGFRINHPSGRERAKGSTSTASLVVDRDLKSRKFDVIPVTEDDLVKILAEASEALAILKGVRTR